MPDSTPTSISRYRPALLILAGAAAGYTAYLVYSISQTTRSGGLRRSNAVRRPNVRTRRHASQVACVSSRLGGDLPVLGEYELHGTQIPFDPRNLVSQGELRELVVQQRPGASPGEIEAIIEHVYSMFLERLLAFMFPHRPPSPVEAEAFTRMVADRYSDQISDSAAVAIALERHALMLPYAATPAVDGAESIANTDLSWGSDEDTEGEGIDPDGQTLQRTLYHIAEDRARQEGVVHRGITCNGCDEKPIRGIRWHCVNCADYDLCSNCEATNTHIRTHIFYKIRVPAPFLGTAKQEPLYPGKPHMMSPSINAVLKKRLIAETKMEAEEIDALWDQFTCLAGTEWLVDPNNIGWALDRRAFNHAFVPRYNSFIAAPNLIYDRIFAYYDSDKNGLIGFEEWIKGLDGMHASHVKSRIVFNGYDVDGDGYISRKDILRIFRAYYAIEKEATRNYVAEITEELSVRNALETIRSSQPLGSAFPPHGPNAQNISRLGEKNQDDFENTEPILRGDRLDVADREEILRAADVRNADQENFVQSERSRIVTDRWARRQFYIDQEEGLSRPDGAEDDVMTQDDRPIDATEQTEVTENLAMEIDARPRCSRSSSRVRFEDDVDIETRSNASTSSRPVGERWGGYEIPEPEKDLGKEVLYQITQQGFNELLNPIFEDRENDAMDAYATRAERRQCATSIGQATECFTSQKRLYLRAICMLGIFRYSQCIIDIFSHAINKASNYGGFKGCFEDDPSIPASLKDFRMRLLSLYAQVQDAFLRTIIVPDDWTVDDMTLWNTWLCQNQLQDEVLAACLDCAMHSNWINAPKCESEHPSHGSSLHGLDRPDPTMPQFKPNSSAEILAANQSATTAEESRSTEPPSTFGHDRFGVYPNEELITSRPEGPFFVFFSPEIEISSSPTYVAADEDDAAIADQIPSLPSLSTKDVLVLPGQSIGPSQDNLSAHHKVANWRNYMDIPIIRLLYLDSSSGIEELRTLSKAVNNSTNPYYKDKDQAKPLYRYIRELAMNPNASSHTVLLASLEAVQQEIHMRKGSGLINFEEFDEHVREGKMRFLESWMEWVSI